MQTSSSNPLPGSPSLLDDEPVRLTQLEKLEEGSTSHHFLKNKPEPIAYDGFEPSGRMHIAQGVTKAINVNKLTDAGCRVKILVADVFAKLNKKMCGDMEKIRDVGKYFIEIWKVVGLKFFDKVEFVWASDVINSRASEYSELVLDIACTFNVPRVKRKVNMLAREYWNIIEKRENRPILLSHRTNNPIILSHHMLPGLKKGQAKMSKSDDSSAIFMEDEQSDQVNEKIKMAHCPPGIVEGNPCLEYIKHIIFPWFQETFENFDDLITDYKSKNLHPSDLKPALTRALNRILKPVQDHFNSDSEAKALLEKVKTKLSKYVLVFCSATM
ncbi:hypothetical protein MKW94_010110 [Papaver nudicaule]|uniref:tyrosine--tRNA ligase n=1 Tax=Papaver nudicaule TaxID=74823 RepID=A0AA42AQ24_PAPNU|nr:hypothetical protein [Papaver nudicaule]